LKDASIPDSGILDASILDVNAPELWAANTSGGVGRINGTHAPCHLPSSETMLAPGSGNTLNRSEAFSIVSISCH